jgi:putative ABC transport system permease protein
MAIRTALGASRKRLVRQLATEGFLLCALGGGLGLFLGMWALSALRVLGTTVLPRVDTVSIEYRVLGFASFLSLLSGLFFAVAPILHSSHLDVNGGLKEGARYSAGTQRQRLRGSFVIANVALALVLLLGAGLLLRSLGRILGTDPGFESANVLTANVDVSGQKYKKDEQIFAFYQQALEKLQSVPGIQSAAVTSQLPLGGIVDGYGVHAEGKLSPNPEMDPSADRYAVSPGYLGTMHIPVLRGRAFTDQDRTDSGMVVLINQTLASRVWPNEDPIGKRVKVGGMDGPWRTIVGVVGDVLHAGLDAPHTMQVYVPQRQWFVESGMVLVVRTAGNPLSMVASVRDAIAQVDKGQPVFKFADMDMVMAESVAQRRFTVFLLTAFAATALMLAALGVYGVVSYFVSMRRQEIGIRMALGATPAAVLDLVLSYGMKLALTGITIGITAGLALSRVLSSQLYHTSAVDPLTMGAVSLLLVAMVGLATYVPAQRATRCDPLIALRHE